MTAIYALFNNLHIPQLGDGTQADIERKNVCRLQRIARNKGMAFEVVPSMRVQTFNWCTGIDLCVPMETRSDGEACALVLLTKAILKRETTLAEEFPSYQYALTDWVAESADREKDRAIANVNS